MQPLVPDDPRTIGPYRILRRLGAGGMGRVFLARSAGGRTVAVKVVHPHFAVDEKFRERFRREVASARRVGTASQGQPGNGSGWTAPVLDADPDAATPWVATGYVAGPSLQQAVTEHGPLPERSVRVLGAGLAAALCHVHGLGLVHRDVKPSNVMLTPDGPRLIDFGIARATDGTASITSTGVSMGSPGYMSPEQALGKGVTYSSDVFSLGSVLAYAARGEDPFPGDSSAALLYKVVHEEPELAGIEGELRELITACLTKEADGRPEPAQLAQRLAEAGDAGGGWLPGPIVEQAGRRAVELLDLEPDESGSGQAGPESGPVPFTTPSYRPEQEPEREPEVPQQRPGAFAQPPVPSSAQAAPLAQGAPAVPSTPPEQAAQSSASGPDERRDTGGGGGGGRPALALTAHAERSRRRISCSLVLTVACVLTAALLGTYFLQGVLGTGGGGGNSDTAQPPAATPSADASSPADEPGNPSRGDVPDGFLGTWKGELTLETGKSVGQMRVTIRQGEAGDQIGRGEIEPADASCEGYYTLRSAAPRTLRVTALSPQGPPLCADSKRIEFTLREDGTLGYVSRGPASGAAKGSRYATLRKAD